MPSDGNYFEDTYGQARDQFRSAAEVRGGRLISYPLAGVLGAEGEELTVDVAVFGRADAKAALLNISGVHGQEAFAGSAAQVSYLKNAFTPPAPEVKYVFVHSLNPYGFSHLSRGNEDHVDLARNFLDFDKEAVDANPLYAEVVDQFTPAVWDDGVNGRLAEAVGLLDHRTSKAELLTILTGGQGGFPKGANYSGIEPARSHLILKSICERELGSAKMVAYLDWHTGLGEYGCPFFISFAEQGGFELTLAQQWFNDPTLGKTEDAFGGDAQPTYRGVTEMGIRRFLPNALIVGAVVEFGTFSGPEVGEALMIDRWLRYGTAPADARFRAEKVRFMMNMLSPSDPEWRRRVGEIGARVTSEAVSGLNASFNAIGN